MIVLDLVTSSSIRSLAQTQQGFQGRMDFPDAHLVCRNVMLRLRRNREAANEFSAFLQEGPLDSRGNHVRHMVAKLQESDAPIGGR